MPKRASTRLKEKVPPAKRLALEQEAQTNMAVARRLLKERKYKEAFKQFKHALTAGEGVNTFPQSAEMAKLAKNYRPALVALKRWRNQKEKLVISGQADSAVFYEWECLNDCLKENDRVLKVFRKLRASGANEEILKSFYWTLWERLVKERQYEDLRQFFSTLGWLTLHHVSQYHAQKWFPRDRSIANTAQSIIMDGALVYETAVALHECGSAHILVEKLLSVDDSDATYAALISSARRARAKQQAQALYEEALERLGPRRVRKSRKALGSLAKPTQRRRQGRKTSICR